MSAEIQMSSAADEVEFPYRAMSSAAVASIVFALIALLSGFFFWPGLALAILGALVSLYGYRQIQRFPEEFDGKNVALTGLVLNLLILVSGAAMHTYIYMTEVPEGYTRVHFWQLQQDGCWPAIPTLWCAWT